MRTGWWIAIAMAMATVFSGCSSGGTGDKQLEAASISNRVSSMTEIPTTLDGNQCYAAFLNNNSEVLFRCPTSEPLIEHYALWNGGDTLLPVQQPSHASQPMANGFRTTRVEGFSDDGSIVGYIQEFTDDRQIAGLEGEMTGNSFSGTSQDIEGFSMRELDEKYFPIENGSTLTVSDNGRYIFINSPILLSDGDNAQSHDRLLDNFVQVQLATLPDDVSFDFGSPVNSGELVGASSVGDAEHTFFARYPSTWSTTSFDFLPVISRPELSVVSKVLSNNTFSVAFSYEAQESVDGRQSERVAFIAPEKTIVPIKLTTETDTVQLIAINDNDVVLGDAYNFDLAVAFHWIFTPGGGSFKLSELFTNAGPETDLNILAIALNDQNELLIQVPGENNSERLFLARLNLE